MKKVLMILFTLTVITSFSQIKFEKGYIIKANDNKMYCLIKNFDWDNNPTGIAYKFLEEGEVKVATIQNIKEFGIGNHSKYQKFTVEIDRSSERLNKISSNRNPEFKTEMLLLKVLIEGEATLYMYNDNNLIRYFYKIGDQPIEQLVYKSFMSPDSQTKAKNENYKQQLFNSLKCSTISYKDIKALDYQKRKLSSLFSKYNQCKNSDYTEFNNKKGVKHFNINAKLGMNNSSLSIINNITNENFYFDNKLGVRLAVEVEYLLPFNKNKWAIVLEPTYQTYKDKQSIDVSNVSGGKLVSSINYPSIEIPLGLRYYLFLKDNSKLFVNVFVVENFSSLKEIELNRADGTNYSTLSVDGKANFAFGLGYKYENFSLELRMQTPRTLNWEGATFDLKYKTASIIFGYTIF